MKYIDEFRSGSTARNLAHAIARAVDPQRSYRFMEFCGGHTHTLSRYGITDLLPAQVQMVHGPGCPVCVLPIGRIDQAIRLALEHNVGVCVYGDCLRVPASKGLSLQKAKAQGGDIRMVYSCADAVNLARQHPEKHWVFFAIGFETTTPPTAVAIRQAASLGLDNFSVLCCHVLTPPAIAYMCTTATTTALDGFIGPGHVSTITGSQVYEPFAQTFGKPVVIAGFEPLDVMQAIRMLIEQVNAGRAVVENEFARAVSRAGNRKAQQWVADVFELRPSFEWRGLGTLPDSALRLRPAFAAFDAEQRFALAYQPVPDHKACECAAILRGTVRPQDCKLFGTVCTPENPIGACMVSSEGACAAHYTYGRHQHV